jgi:hypothetical protein
MFITHSLLVVYVQHILCSVFVQHMYTILTIRPVYMYTLHICLVNWSCICWTPFLSGICVLCVFSYSIQATHAIKNMCCTLGVYIYVHVQWHLIWFTNILRLLMCAYNCCLVYILCIICKFFMCAFYVLCWHMLNVIPVYLRYISTLSCAGWFVKFPNVWLCSLCTVCFLCRWHWCWTTHTAYATKFIYMHISVCLYIYTCSTWYKVGMRYMSKDLFLLHMLCRGYVGVVKYWLLNVCLWYECRKSDILYISAMCYVSPMLYLFYII